MPKELPDPIFEALVKAQERKALPTSLGTAELRDMAAGIRARAIFTARGSSTLFADALKRIIDSLTSGDIDMGSARAAIREVLKALQYTPEGGFPDTAVGEVPPALKGSLQDLSSFRRLDLIVRTQLDLFAGSGDLIRGMEPTMLREFPAWELIRVSEVMVARDWPSRWALSGGEPPTDEFKKNAHQILGESTGMIALKADPVWGELGSSENFSDALDVDYPPFAFNSGMGWRPVSRAEWEQRGLAGPDGQTVEEFHSGVERPRVILGELPLPAPQISLEGVDPKLIEDFKKSTGWKPGSKPAVVRYDDIMERELAKSRAAYQKLNPDYNLEGLRR
jgi:hypothetical protein